MISVVIRSRNEEHWIRQCLQRVLQQTLAVAKDVEVILVDNASSDRTVAKAKNALPDITIVEITDYLPGKALNRGISASSGELVVCLSAHCLPVRDDWLSCLAAALDNPEVAGVYGRQLPMEFTSAQDKRDLFNTFGLDPRLQRRDTFFHNANSMLRRSVWEQIPFDESVTNIEDRLWAQAVHKAGYAVAYEPEAAVFHHHGIHQNGHEERCQGVVRIMESMYQEIDEQERLAQPRPEDHDMVAVVSVQTRNASDTVFAPELLEAALASLRESRYLSRIILAVDDTAIVQGFEAKDLRVILRPPELSHYGARADDVLRHVLDILEQEGHYPDLLVPMEITCPFRPPGIVDTLARMLVEQGMDTVITGVAEYRPCWQPGNGGLQRLDSPDRPRMEREPLLIGLPTLCCVTRPRCLRLGSRLGQRLRIVEVYDPLCTLEVRTPSDLELYRQVIAPGIRQERDARVLEFRTHDADNR